MNFSQLKIIKDSRSQTGLTKSQIFGKGPPNITAVSILGSAIQQ